MTVPSINQRYIKPMKNCITVIEFDKISVKTFIDCGVNERLARKAFIDLEKFVLPTSDSENSDEINFNEYGELKDASVCMSVGSENRVKIIRVKNYVGTISLPCGVTIEVLPKITTLKANENDIKVARKLVIEMLKTCSDIFYKSFQNADLSTESLNLFEVYISLFLAELDRLFKKGLKAGYVMCNGNEMFLKGRLLFNEHVKRNFSHKEKFYIEYDEFNFNRAENRLIKSTIEYLLHKSQLDSNKRRLTQYLLSFDEVSLSENIEVDFARCENGRSGRDYEQIIKLCRVFLHRKSFTMYHGDKNVAALMFPMETLFERYVAREMGKHLHVDWKLYAQKRGNYLFDGKLFSLRPDVVLKNTNCERLIILDTKWKRLKSNEKESYGISQADMYQMYVYHTRFPKVKEVVLLYPYYEDVINLNDIQFVISDLSISVYVAFFDLKEYQKTKLFSKCIYGLNSKSYLLSLLSQK